MQITKEVALKKILANEILGLNDSLFVCKIANSLGLKDISKGFDTLNIRMWIWGKNYNWLFNIEGMNNSSSANIIQFKFEQTNDSTWIVVQNDIRDGKPLFGWDNIYNLLDKYHITGIMKHNEINRMKFNHVGSYWVSFEIAQSNGYHFFKFLDPAYYRHAYNEALDIYSFLKQMNQQFDCEFYKPIDSLYWIPKEKLPTK